MKSPQVSHNTLDAAGSIVGLLVALAGATGILEKTKLSPDQLAEILGIMLTLAAVLRLKFVEERKGDG